jgi:Flp pilus assembly protein TadG
MRRRGQATVEFALMVPVIFMVLFAAVELGFLFADTHYTTYAAFAGARAQQVGQSASEATDMLLDGGLTRNARVQASSSNGSVQIKHVWPLDLPMLAGFGNIDYDVTVVAGPNEAKYENRSGNLSRQYADNNGGGRR